MTSLPKDGTVLPLPQSGGGAPEDALRTMLQHLIHETLEREFQQFLGAARFERSPERRGVRNGHRRRRLLTRVGSLELKVPRDRAGAFQPALFARYQRSEQALVLALIEMYWQGISTRKVSAVVEQLCGATISASEVSALTKTLDASLAAWRSRGLGAKAYPYLVVDAHYERVRREGQVRSTAALWVIGVGADGYREHLGVWLGASESGASWRRVFEDLVKRGLTGVRYVVSDEHAGLVDAIRRYFPDAAHQRCQVHFLRNARDHVSSEDLRQRVRDGLRNVWSSATCEEADARLVRLGAELRPKSARLADWLEQHAPDTLAVYALADREARRRLATTNSIEHDHAEVRRRTRVVRVFPNEASFLRLASALAVERNEQWLVRRYVGVATDARAVEEAADAA
ncbi:MAG TPA: IS256 family transposase [Gemmatimonadaceae bacterium]